MCEHSLKWRGHCRELGELGVGFVGVSRQVVESLGGCAVVAYGDRYDLRGSVHIAELL